MRTIKLLFLVLVFGLVGCNSNPTRDWAEDLVDQASSELNPEYEALRTVTLELTEIPPLDFSTYKDIQYTIYDHDNGTSYVIMTIQDHTNLLLIMKEIEGYIRNERLTRLKVKEFYDKQLRREGVHQ